LKRIPAIERQADRQYGPLFFRLLLNRPDVAEQQDFSKSLSGYLEQSSLHLPTLLFMM
jgi:hypothetical protein